MTAWAATAVFAVLWLIAKGRNAHLQHRLKQETARANAWRMSAERAMEFRRHPSNDGWRSFLENHPEVTE